MTSDKTWLSPLTQENDRLIQTVHKQCGTINELRQTIVEKNIQIQELENNQKLICEDMDEIRIGLNEAEQYSKRNAIRITKRANTTTNNPRNGTRFVSSYVLQRTCIEDWCESGHVPNCS